MIALLMSGLALGSTIVLLAVGFSIVYNTTRVFHFAHGFIFTFAGYSAVTLNVELGVPLLLASLLAVVPAAIVGMACETLVYRPMRNRDASALSLFTASFGILVAGSAIIQMIWGPTSKRLDLPSGASDTVAVLGTFVTKYEIWTIALAVLLLVVVVVVLNRTSTGLFLRAVSSNTERSYLIGLKPMRVYLMALAIGSALTVPAAVLSTARFGIEPAAGFRLILLVVVAQVVGGLGSIPGAILASYVVGLTATLPLLVIDPKWSQAVVFLLLFLVLILRPHGLLGEREARRYEAT